MIHHLGIPFGGVLILGTMDHTQIKILNQLPFLTSSFLLTCFYAIEPQNSIRAHRGLYFQRLQQIKRINPFDLIRNDVIKYDFFRLAGGILTFLPNWEDNHIDPNMMSDLSIVMIAQEDLN